MEKSYLFLADGFEEIEALAVVDILRRGGVDLIMVSITDNKHVKGAHNIEVIADCILSDILNLNAECLILPGGLPGAANLAECTELIEMLQKQYNNNKYIASICAAPALVLTKLKVKQKVAMTCYPGFEGKYTPNFEYSEAECEITDKIITAKGPGYANQFAFAVLEKLTSPEIAQQVANGMLICT